MGYRGKLEEQDRARVLRAEGWTMPEIAEELGVARSSVSKWTRDVPYVPRRPRKSPQAGRPNKLRDQRLAEISRLNEQGVERIGILKRRELLIAGLALYAGDGSKTDGTVQFANSNADLVRFFCTWLRRNFAIDEGRLRLHLYLHQGLDLDAAIRHWSDITGIPPTQFGKPYRAVPDATIRHNKHEHGCCHVRYCCSRTHREIMGMMRALVSCDAIPG
jgi:transcriptional regulator with XRE-family HTH domain